MAVAARLRVFPAIYPGDGTMVMFSDEATPRKFVFDLTGPPPDPSAVLDVRLKAIADAIIAQTEAMATDDKQLLADNQKFLEDDQKFLAAQTPKPAA